MPVEAQCRLESLQLGAGGTLATEIEDLSRQVPFPELLGKAVLRSQSGLSGGLSFCQPVLTLVAGREHRVQ